jgi:thiamine-monophosphate kinase
MGEFELLARIRERLPAPGPRVRLASGDDCAVTVPGGATATSIDALVEGVHFRRSHSSAAQIGRKALSVALSDLAAMGAEPGEAYVALAVPPDLGEEECLQLLDGMVEVAGETGTTIAGGDLTRAAELSLTVTVVGHADRAERLIGRGGAHRGDSLVLTGELGAAAAGLLALEQPAAAAALPPEVLAALRSRQLDPSPRLEAGRALARCGATAMIDLSDGLGGDAAHIARSSGSGARIDAGLLPLAEGVAEVASALNRDPLELAVSGGEDYELLAALPAERVGRAAEEVGAVGPALTVIGEVRGDGVEIRRPGGEPLPARGFDQLR